LSLGKLVSIEILTKKPSASIGGGSSLHTIVQGKLKESVKVYIIAIYYNMKKRNNY